MIRILAAILVLMSNTALATTVVMDFEGVTDAGGVALFQSPYSEDGLTLTHSGGAGEGIFGANFPETGSGIPPNSNSNGTSVFGWCAATAVFGSGCANAQVTITADAPSTGFNLLSMDLANLHDYGSSGPTGTFSIEGLLIAGGSVSTTFDFAIDTWNTLSFDSSWSGLSAVTVSAVNSPGYDAAIDNITVALIPIPAAGWLFLSGMGLLLGFRRAI